MGQNFPRSVDRSGREGRAHEWNPRQGSPRKEGKPPQGREAQGGGRKPGFTALSQMQEAPVHPVPGSFALAPRHAAAIRRRQRRSQPGVLPACRTTAAVCAGPGCSAARAPRCLPRSPTSRPHVPRASPPPTTLDSPPSFPDPLRGSIIVFYSYPGLSLDTSPSPLPPFPPSPQLPTMYLLPLHDALHS